MSNTIINWRLWHWHLRVIRWGDWPGWVRDGRSPITLTCNEWHRGPGSLRYPERLDFQQDPEWKWIELYEGLGYVPALLALIALIVWALL